MGKIVQVALQQHGMGDWVQVVVRQTNSAVQVWVVLDGTVIMMQSMKKYAIHEMICQN